MIQVNLLPDIKGEYVKAERTKRTVITISLLTIAVSLGIIGILASVAYAGQKLQLSAAQSKTKSLTAEIEKNKDLDKVLTVQSQLLALPELHEQKPIASRLFGYLQQTTPKDARIDTFKIDFENNTVLIQGNAPSLEIVNKYVDTLKFTKISQTTNADNGTTPVQADLSPAFTTVVLSDFQTNQNQATYTISLKVDPVLFDLSAKDISLVVPNIVTTRSQTEQPTVLFQQNNNDDSGDQ